MKRGRDRPVPAWLCGAAALLAWVAPALSFPPGETAPGRPAQRLDLLRVAADAPGGATIDGASWTADRSFAVTTTIAGKPILNVNLFKGSTPLAHFGFNVMLAKAGDYVGSYDVIGYGGTGGVYTPDQLNPDILTFHYEVKGKLAITTYDAARRSVSGTFSGTATNHAGGKPVIITNGTFRDVDIRSQ